MIKKILYWVSSFFRSKKPAPVKLNPQQKVQQEVMHYRMTREAHEHRRAKNRQARKDRRKNR